MEETKISRQKVRRFGRIRLLFYPLERGLLLPRADLEEEEGRGCIQLILKIRMSSLSYKSYCGSMSSSTHEVNKENT